ncbi:hypothetical protein GGI23_007073, partial [Coemansia sp. RSA 2559]
MADDLSLMANSRQRLQRVADFVAGWFRMAGVQVNAAKTEHISYGSPENATVLSWQTEEGPEGRTEITQRPQPGLGIRILGQKLVANGSTEAVVEDTTMFVEDLVAGVQRHRITDRIGQMYCRAVLFPTVVYRLMGQPLLDSELKKIEGPIVRFLKHAFGMPSTTPTSLIRHQKGANMPTLASVMATRNLDLTLRQMNGAGAPFFS